MYNEKPKEWPLSKDEKVFLVLVTTMIIGGLVGVGYFVGILAGWWV